MTRSIRGRVVALTMVLVAAGATLGVVGGLSSADDKVEPRARGQLYPNWKKLGLSDSQVQEIYKIQTKYRTKIEALEVQIRELKKQERSDAEKVLTDAQKARLKEILSGDAPKDKTPTKDKTPPKDKVPSKDK